MMFVDLTGFHLKKASCVGLTRPQTFKQEMLCSMFIITDHRLYNRHPVGVTEGSGRAVLGGATAAPAHILHRQ